MVPTEIATNSRINLEFTLKFSVAISEPIPLFFSRLAMFRKMMLPWIIPLNQSSSTELTKTTRSNKKIENSQEKGDDANNCQYPTASNVPRIDAPIIHKRSNLVLREMMPSNLEKVIPRFNCDSLTSENENKKISNKKLKIRYLDHSSS